MLRETQVMNFCC